MPHSGESRTKETWSLTSEQWQWHVFGKNWLEKTIDKRQRKNVWDLVDIWDILIQLSCNRWGNRGLESYLLSAYRLISGKSGSGFLISCFSFWCWSTTSCRPILPVARMNAPLLQPPSRWHICSCMRTLPTSRGESSAVILKGCDQPWLATLQELSYGLGLRNHTVPFRLEGYPLALLTTSACTLSGEALSLEEESRSPVVLDTCALQVPVPSSTPFPNIFQSVDHTALSSEDSSWYLCETQKCPHCTQTLPARKASKVVWLFNGYNITLNSIAVAHFHVSGRAIRTGANKA